MSLLLAKNSKNSQIANDFHNLYELETCEDGVLVDIDPKNIYFQRIIIREKASHFLNQNNVWAEVSSYTTSFNTEENGKYLARLNLSYLITGVATSINWYEGKYSTYSIFYAMKLNDKVVDQYFQSIGKKIGDTLDDIYLEATIFNIPPGLHTVKIEIKISCPIVSSWVPYVNFPESTKFSSMISYLELEGEFKDYSTTAKKVSSYILPTTSNSSLGSGYKTRYIVLKSKFTGENYLQVSQLACYDEAGNNVAKGKPVSATNVYSSEINPNNITSGVLSIKNHPASFHSKGTNPEEIRIDLGSEINVNRCVYYNRGDCCQRRIIGAMLELQDAAKNVSASYVFEKGDLIINVIFPTQRFIFIKAANNGDNWLQISQIACYDKAGNNITQGKKVTASTLYYASPDPQIITDGNLKGRNWPNIFHGGKVGNDEVTIDLGGAYDIEKCVFYNRTDCCVQRIIGAKLETQNASRKAVNTYIFKKADTVQEINFSKARFINLKAGSSGDHWLNFSQLACYDEHGNNLAYRKDVTASSLYESAIQTNRITDGILAVRDHPASFHCANQNNCEITIDLGDSFKISKCVFYNRGECCKNRIIDAKLTLQDEWKNAVRSYIFDKGDDKIDIPL